MNSLQLSRCYQRKSENMYTIREHNNHYLQLLQIAEQVVDGPRSIKISSEFWGWSYLALTSTIMPKIGGVIESRIIYANPSDEEQNRGILRQVLWDAKEARDTILADAKEGRKPSITQPSLQRQTVWVSNDWIQSILLMLDTLLVPIRALRTSHFRDMCHIRLEKSDRSVFEVSWGKGTEREYEKLTSIWETIWAQSAEFLQSSEQIHCEELWQDTALPSRFEYTNIR